MTRRLLSFAFWAFMAVSSGVLFPIAVLLWALTAAFDPRRVILHRFTCFWGSLYTWLNPAWQLEIAGREKIRSDEAYVMVSNHLSLLDILVMMRLFRHFMWVSKVENFRVPLIGWNMSLVGYIKLRRGDRASVVEMLNECRRALEAGNSIMMFPEGTRSPDGRMRAFKPGAFEIALRARRPILPIAIEGTANALPKRGFVLQGRYRLGLTVLDPIPYAAFAGDSVEQLTERVRDRIARQVEPGEPARAAVGT